MNYGTQLGGNGQHMNILPEWESIDPTKLKGTLFVMGVTDVGKSTFARYLYGRLRKAGRRVAYLDGDPGQGCLGPSTVMTLTTEKIVEKDLFRQQGSVRWRFVGAPTPVGHMLPMLVGSARLIKAAQEAGMESVIYDTTGLIDPNRGGLHLKLAKINLLRPSTVFAIEREGELEPLTRPLRLSRRLQVVRIPVSPGVKCRDLDSRRAFRAEKFAQYFSGARPVKISWAHLAVFPTPAFRLNLLVAMEDTNGYVLGLGIIQRIMEESREVTLVTPLSSLQGVDAITLGDVILDSQTFFDQPASVD